ncbi:ligase-associated DNA damage response endonuclease PdeM [Flavobacterium pallidum]|uniref:Ligase-associated DNA damage response endonuclease PdeM n=1 Tax=Flavobacterium pallidum TaxID=2172098 RepID=A0A2S1SEA4_9FLAO|nr:ligase-associated DNA damage response endonuclease PdeM [Flavobacterium pallidum]AWI24687.1 ligase-associated DNA damage response endonuclease PdeM [Flavobacterium pallidum]
MTQTISIRNNTFILHPSAALFWQEKNTLLISDVHLGKVSHFRKHGMAIPENAVAMNFHRLDGVLDFFSPEAVIFMGDLFHSKKNREWELFDGWVKSAEAKIILVAGNHDIISQQHYDDLGVLVLKEILTDGFLLTHHPEQRDDLFNICGHIHPAIELRGIGKQFMKLPCFFQRENQMILPAFGEFTGTYVLIPETDDCVYAIAKDRIVKVC